MEADYQELRKADLIIVIGTSLQVMPFAGLVDLAHRKTPRLLINREAVGPFEYLRNNQTRGNDSLWLGDADDGVQALVDELGWTEEFAELCRVERKRLDKEWGEREAALEKKVAAEEKKEVEKERNEAEKKAKEVATSDGPTVGEEDEAVQKLSELIDQVKIDKTDKIEKSEPKAKV